MYDIIIVGAGPAGLSAAITARSRNKSVLVISNDPMTSLLAKAHLINNYPGMYKTSGADILKHMINQASDMGAEMVYKRAMSAVVMDDNFLVSTSKESFQARSLILATGKDQAKPYVGENEFMGRGVSHCATCDGMFFRNATVAVVGLSEEAVREANFLVELGSTVNFVSPKPVVGLDAAVSAYVGKVDEIIGDNLGVQCLVFTGSRSEGAQADSAPAALKQTIECTGVFVLREQIAPGAFVAGLELSEDRIKVDGQQKTTVSGVFAAGDCTGKPLQVAKAVGEGQIACFAAIDYLEAK